MFGKGSRQTGTFDPIALPTSLGRVFHVLVFQVGPGHIDQDSADFVVQMLDFLTSDERDWLMRRTAEEFVFKKK